MAIGSTNATTGSILPGTMSTTTSNDLAGISGNDFMQVLIKQLQFQDPLKPMDNQQMVQQMATIRELETNTQLSDKLQQLTSQQRFAGATSLMGKHVKGMLTDENGTEFPADGVVKSIRFTDSGDVILELDSGQSLPITKLQEVVDASTASSTPATNGASTNTGTNTPNPTTQKGVLSNLISKIF